MIELQAKLDGAIQTNNSLTQSLAEQENDAMDQFRELNDEKKAVEDQVEELNDQIVTVKKELGNKLNTLEDNLWPSKKM